MSGLPYPSDFNQMPMPPAGGGPSGQNYQAPPAYPSDYRVESSNKMSQAGYPQQQAFVHGQPAPPPQNYNPGYGHSQNQGYPQQSYHQNYPPQQSYPNQYGQQQDYGHCNMKKGKDKKKVKIPFVGEVKQSTIKKGAGALAAGYAAKKMGGGKIGGALASGYVMKKFF